MYNDALFGEATEQLKQAVREGRTFDTAQVKVIGLEDIRQAAGENWSQIKSRVQEGSLRFLRTKLAEGDLIIPCGNGFLIIYGGSEERDLERACVKLQDDLNLFYLGLEAVQKLRTEVAGRKVDASGIANIVATAASEPGFAPEQSGEIFFMPAWDVAQEVVTTYFVTPVLREAGGVRCGYNSVYQLTGRHEGCDFLDPDMQILERAVSAIARNLETGAHCVIGYSVHATTLQKRASRQTFLQRLFQTPESVRKYLIGRIAEIEPGTPVITLADWVSQLQRVSPRVSLDMHPHERSLHGLDATRAWCVGCVLPVRGHLSASLRVQYRALITRWRLAVQRQGLKVAFDNINDPVLLAAACVEGVDFATSGQYWPLLTAPRGIVPSSRRTVLNLAKNRANAG